MGPVKDNRYLDGLSNGVLGHNVGLLIMVELPIPPDILIIQRVDIEVNQVLRRVNVLWSIPE